MPYLEDPEDIMDDSKPEVSVVDVYDIASEIGKEFEKMIDVHGTDAVISLMPKVINALEQLEGLATRNERENNQVQELRARIAQLEKDKIGKAEDRHRFERELEQIEEHWREESRDLEAMVAHLQDENRKLSSVLAEKRQAEKSPDPGALLSPEVDMALLQRLRGLVDRLKDQLRQRDRELQSKQNELDSLTGQVEQLTIISRELRRKQRLGQAQIHSLIDERADFLAQVHDQQREVQLLRQRLGLAEKENEDLSISAKDSMDLTNKVIYDKDDPNRPRFTTQELKDILHERNELKARVSDLEDELEMYRPKEHPQSPQEEELIVEGPLPQEPDDAPWKKTDSGIRKFFRRLFSEGVTGGGTSSVLPFVGGSMSSGSKPILSSSLSKIGLSGHLSSTGAAGTTV